MDLCNIEDGSVLYEAALTLRYELFFKDFGLPKDITADELESVSTHIALTDQATLLAYGRLSPLDAKQYRISQIVVPEKFRHNGYASTIVSELMKQAKAHGASEVILSSQAAIAPLYKKLGFREIGDIYVVELTGVKHQKMLHRFGD